MSRLDTVIEKLSLALSPKHLSVLDESHMHNVPKGAESHFKVVIVSELFAKMLPVKRHQTVYKVLEEELAKGLHALSIQAFCPEQWRDASISASPDCRGGSKN